MDDHADKCSLYVLILISNAEESSLVFGGASAKLQTMQKTLFIFLILTGTAVAHENVTNPAVMKRMHVMDDIAADTKRLVEMVKGTTDYDPAIANATLETLAEYAKQVVARFEAPEDDPKSEAKSEIWDNFTDFSEKAGLLVNAASVKITSFEELETATASIGATCKACHKLYRE